MKKRIFAVLILLLVTLPVASCKNTTEKHMSATTTAKEKEAKLLAAIEYVDPESRNISLADCETLEKEYYTFNESTRFFMASGTEITASQLKPGSIVDVKYAPSSKRISSIKITENSDVWENTRVSSFKIDETTHSMTIGSSRYSYSDNTLVLSNGIRADIMTLNRMDRLIVRGYKSKVVSIVVDKGHGYISLSGVGLFYGGYVNVEGILAKVIEKDMLLLVTEGNYTVTVQKNGVMAQKSVKVERDLRSDVNFSDVKVDPSLVGNVIFNVDISGATLYIDGAKTDYSSVVTLAKGKHKIVLEAGGYKSYEAEIEVDDGLKQYDISLLKEDETKQKETTSRGETASSGETTQNPETSEKTETSQQGTTMATEKGTIEGETVVSGSDRITVKADLGTSIYFDSKYMGQTSVSFPLVTGTHVITTLNDMKVSSYTVELAEGNDVVFDYTTK